MIIKELIEELKKYDENTPVMFCSENEYVYDIGKGIERQRKARSYIMMKEG